MAGSSAERQETGVVKAIQNAVRKNANNPITVCAGKTKVHGVVKAYKFTGRQQGGSEPYTDVVLETESGKMYNCSLKGEAAPSLAGGGLKGLELAVPGITRRFMKKAFQELTKKGLKRGSKVPDVYGQIAGPDKKKIVIGNKAMGGPIQFMYIGPMDVVSKYNEDANELNLNGQLIPAGKYADTHKLFFRLRARREDQRFDPTAKESDGTPKIYGKSPSKGDSAGRIVVTDKVPSTGLVVRM